MNSVPPVRIQKCNEGPINPKENYVLYWMAANRRIHMRKADRVFQTAYAFRRFLQKTLYSHLFEKPKRDPLKESKLKLLRSLPPATVKRWPKASMKILKGEPKFLQSISMKLPAASGRGISGASSTMGHILKI